MPRSQQTGTATIAQKAIAAGFEGIQVDGNDILAVREVIGDAIDKARAGGGPTLIEALSYRLSDHTTADDATRYQPSSEVNLAKPKEPIARFKQFLMEQQLWSTEQEDKLQEHCSQQVENAVKEYLSSKTQPVSTIFDFHYANLPDYLIEQRAIAMEEAANA